MDYYCFNLTLLLLNFETFLGHRILRVNVNTCTKFGRFKKKSAGS